MGLSPLQELPEGLALQPLQREDCAAREQRAIDLEAGVLGGCANERDRAGFDKGQEAVLLGAVEAVYLVDEEQGSLPRSPSGLGGVESRAQIPDAGEDSTDRLEGKIGLLCKEPGNCRLSNTRRPPENKGCEPASLEHPFERAFGAEQMVLPHHLRQTGRAQPVGEGTRRGFLKTGCRKEISGHGQVLTRPSGACETLPNCELTFRMTYQNN